MAERSVEEALHEVQSAVNSARRSRGAAEVNLVGLLDAVPQSTCEEVERVAREQGLAPQAIAATVGVRLRGDGQDAQANELALPFLEAAAELGDAMAANTAGLAILDLGGDRERARGWLLEGARGGDSQAQFNAGALYCDDGDFSRAKDLLEKSSDPRAGELLARIAREIGALPTARSKGLSRFGFQRRS